MANNTISQVLVNGTTYDLLDANTLSAVSALKERVTALESSVSNKDSIKAISSSNKIRFDWVTASESNDGRSKVVLYVDSTPMASFRGGTDLVSKWTYDANAKALVFYNDILGRRIIFWEETGTIQLQKQDSSTGSGWANVITK